MLPVVGLRDLRAGPRGRRPTPRPPRPVPPCHRQWIAQASTTPITQKPGRVALQVVSLDVRRGRDRDQRDEPGRRPATGPPSLRSGVGPDHEDRPRGQADEHGDRRPRGGRGSRGGTSRVRSR
jgi:hypothetical protein